MAAFIEQILSNKKLICICMYLYFLTIYFNFIVKAYNTSSLYYYVKRGKLQKKAISIYLVVVMFFVIKKNFYKKDQLFIATYKKI